MEDAGLTVGWCKVHQIDRLRGAPQAHHIDQNRILNQAQPLRLTLQRGKIISNFKHAAGNCGQND
jgi:hypothetical protein